MERREDNDGTRRQQRSARQHRTQQEENGRSSGRGVQGRWIGHGFTAQFPVRSENSCAPLHRAAKRGYLLAELKAASVLVQPPTAGLLPVLWLLHKKCVPTLRNVYDTTQTCALCWSCRSALYESDTPRMPCHALSNVMFGGRDDPRLRDISEGTRLLLPMANVCYRQVYCTQAKHFDKTATATGMAGAPVVLANAPTVSYLLKYPPAELNKTFTVISVREDYEVTDNCKWGIASRDEFTAAAECLATQSGNPVYSMASVNSTVVESLPAAEEQVWPQILKDCIVVMPEAGQHAAKGRTLEATGPKDAFQHGGPADAQAHGPTVRGRKRAPRAPRAKCSRRVQCCVSHPLPFPPSRSEKAARTTGNKAATWQW